MLSPKFHGYPNMNLKLSTQLMKRRSAHFQAASLALATSALLALGGCASSSGISPSARSLSAAELGLGQDSVAAAPMPTPDWWQEMADGTLNQLMERALASNPGLRVVQARLARAQAAVQGTQALDGPQLNGSADVSRQHFSSHGIYPPPLGGEDWTLSNAQLGGSWELDFFGRNRAAIEAAVGTQRAARAELQAARLLLTSQLARGYVQLARLLSLRDIATRTLQQRQQMLALVQQRVQSGLDTTLELRQGEGALPEAQQQIEQLDEQISVSRHALAALTAQAPEALNELRASLPTLPTKLLPASVPADLLGRRADVDAARWRAQAASADMRSAKAQFYPNINLSAFVGLSSIGLDKLTQSGSEQYGAGAALHLPIFDSGRLRANLSARTSEFDAAVESYNSTVLDAMRDAADQISSLQAIERQQAQQKQAQAAAESAYAISNQRYQAGLGNYLMLLNAETALLTQRRQATELQARALDTRIALIRALGGGYSAEAGKAQLAASSGS